MRRTPYLIQLAWYTLEFHRHHTCTHCTRSGWCSAVQVARTRLTAWYRYRP
ncbi:hypothetical protein [Micromonospora cathayae]|uniref:Uncharacterized protein n=1 Tax=Micromonospora cathayae TaxID=3028804 RepID=A0ABY7ZSA2_9ACTN|nr:hypothetical protein [Micromonospora sp. HUAS 3]WDZ85910.1 hypothetical protein PVK37_05630 [Micromonospora sp. HUAS 3]